MHAKTIATIIFGLILATAGAIYYFRKPATRPARINIKQTKSMKIISPAFENNTSIPPKYTCEGTSFSPPLAISGVPASAKSLTLILHDPDAPIAGGFTHWVLFNFDPKTSGIEENSVPQNAVQGQNGAGQSRYAGPCPPTGTHRYFFTLYALDKNLDLSSTAKKADVESAMQGHILEQTELIGLYEKQK